MQEEIFGPILPLISYKNLDEVILYINNNPSPLALYLFTENKMVIKRFLDECTFGGGCINDTIMHVSSDYLPFGGVGESGMGSYHGKASFDTFTHYRSVLHKSTKLDIKMRYAPYTKSKEKITRIILK
jgi:aldehyde dehydrogenase (NAD+)